jgi:hypothetical protein
MTKVVSCNYDTGEMEGVRRYLLLFHVEFEQLLFEVSLLQ